MNVTLVIVLYNMPIQHSPTINSILSSNNVNYWGNLSLIVYDNSPSKQSIGWNCKELKMEYIHDSRNLGIAAAYNYAWIKAKENGSDWLLLLDQDTEITSEYLEEIFTLKTLNRQIAAITPQVYSKNMLISPVQGNTLRPLKQDTVKPGIHQEPLMAINSGSLISIHFLNDLNGFNDEEFPLDYLDHWLFYEIFSRGYAVWVLHSVLSHDLSVMDYRNISLTRYQSILDSEIQFYRNYHKKLYKPYRWHLVKRLIKQLIFVPNKKIPFYTIRRIFMMKGGGRG